jgi:hypothetical protein
VKFIFIAAIAGVASLPSNATAQGTFICRVLDVGQVGSDGRLLDNRYTSLIEDSDMTFSFDPETGSYAEDLITWRFRVLQNGTEENSLKAIRILEGPAATVVQYLSIETFAENSFLFAWDTEVRSGTCELVE